MKKTLLSFVMVMVVFCMGVTAQVTTSGLSGQVTSSSGAPMVGAAVRVVHTPSGTEYATITDAKGQFRLVNLRPGGPYDVKTLMLGFKSVVSSGILIALGETYVIRQTMTEESTDINAVIVTGVRNSIMNSERTGAVTNVNQRQIETMPTGNRSINDFVRLTPQAGNNGTFGARDTRYNNITIDGAQLANRFGLSTTNIMPGGDAQPFSLDAVQEISVSITPFDVRQSNFTGANINAVTKSGTNKFHGSAYGYIKPKTFVGEKIGDNTIRNARQTDKQTFGVTLGGPIVKNKLFFFVTGELEQTTSPGNLWIASTNGTGNEATKTSRASVSDLQAISKFFKDNYQYETGSFGGGKDNVSKNHKIVARLDWNINRNHKAMVRYNDVVSTNDQLVNPSSGPVKLENGGRNSIDALSFYNSGYNFENTVRSITAELNSQFTPTISNKLLATYSFIQDKRTPFGAMFPFIDIFKDGKGYTNMGTELFSVNNVLENRSFTIFDNLTFSLGDHSLTVGASYENEFFSNGYMREGSTYYAYNWNTSTHTTVDDFLNAFKTMKPTAFGYQLPLPGKSDPRNELTFGLASAYIQDEWTISPKFTFTAGLRMDLPIYITPLQGPTFTETNASNPNQTIAVKEIKFADGNYYDLSKWGSAKPLFSPRVGFNWDVFGDRSLQVRGGSGIFTGMLPFVWFTNQPGSAGFAQTAETTITKAAEVPSGLVFNPDYMQQVFGAGSVLGSAPREGITKTGANFAKVDDNFKLPQVWRTSLAADIDLCHNMILTLEGMYSKDINAILQKNVNLGFDEAARYAGPDNRPIIQEKMVGYVNSMTLLTNTSKGYQASFTAQLTKNFQKGWAGMIAYTGTIAKDQSANPGSTALSAFKANATAGDPNNPEMSYSGFLAPHRVTGYVSYSVDWLKHLTSTFSVYYSGQNNGRVSYTFSNDMTGSNSTKDLIYIPKDKSEMRFVDNKVTDTKSPKYGNVLYAAKDQAEDFEKFIQGNSYLNSRRGQYAERFGDNQPWLNRFDFKFLQDIYSNFGTDERYSLQFSVDILNIGNLICNEWGVYKTNGMQSYENFQVLTFDKRQADNSYTYKLNATDRADFMKKTSWVPSQSVSSTWSIILGVRLKF